MRRSKAIALARDRMAELGLPWGKVTGVEKIRDGWIIVTQIVIDLSTPTGRAQIWVSGGWEPVNAAVLWEPDDPCADLPPPWEAFPKYPWITTGWGQGPGETYWLGWHQWFDSLTEEQRQRYQQRHPAPADPVMGWGEFYEFTAMQRRREEEGEVGD